MAIPRITLGTLGVIFALSMFGKLPGELVVLSILAGAIVLGIHGWVTGTEPHDPTRDTDDGPPPPATLFATQESVLGARRASRIPADLPLTAFAELHLRPRGDQAVYQAAYELMVRGIAVRLVATKNQRDGFGDGLTAMAPTVTYTTWLLTPHIDDINSIDAFSRYVAFRTGTEPDPNSMPASRTWWTYDLSVWTDEWEEAAQLLTRLGYRLDDLHHPERARLPTQDLR